MPSSPISTMLTLEWEKYSISGIHLQCYNAVLSLLKERESGLLSTP